MIIGCGGRRYDTCRLPYWFLPSRNENNEVSGAGHAFFVLESGSGRCRSCEHTGRQEGQDKLKEGLLQHR